MNKEYIKDLLRQIIKIFVRYFTVFFIVLLTLSSVAQYKDQGKISLPDSITFSFPIAYLGAALAAISIGLFTKLELAQPWVQASEYVEVNESVINRGLSKIRKKRILMVTMLVMWLPFGGFIVAINLPIYAAFAYMATVAIISQLLYFSKCPRCNHYFFYRSKPGVIGDTGNAKLNLLFGLGYRNIFSSKCLNCGLRINNDESI